MLLTADDCEVLQSTWEKVCSHQEEIGAEVLARLFVVYPSAKTYFPHFDLHPGSEQVRCHGKKVVGALAEALKDPEHLSQCLADLSNLHAYSLRVDPVNFKLLSQCFLVVLATRLKSEFDAAAHAAWDKFLAAVSAVLTEKYR